MEKERIKVLRKFHNYYEDLNGVRENIARALNLKDGMKALDVGTGDGWFAIELAKQIENGEVIGIDITDEIEEAKEHAQKVGVRDICKFLRMDAYKLDFLDDYFDLVGSFLALQDICNSLSDLHKVAMEMSRVLKPQGRIVIAETTPEDAETPSQRLGIKIYEEFGSKFFAKKNIIKALERANIEILNIKFYHTGVNLLPDQARLLIKSECEFLEEAYGLEKPDWEPIWRKYKSSIERYGGLEIDAKVTTIIGKSIHDRLGTSSRRQTTSF